MLAALSDYLAYIVLAPFIGAEFMPHLDEGALWVRATMPYTISFDEASKLGPQVGESVPDFSLKDQAGKVWTRQSIMGPKGAMLVFLRSADW